MVWLQFNIFNALETAVLIKINSSRIVSKHNKA